MLTKTYPGIPKRFPDRFPADFDNRVRHFGFFTREEVEQNAGKLLMLDIDFGRYCSLHCPGCFRRENEVDDTAESDLSYAELIEVVDQARGLGLQSIKICGAGEPTEHHRFLQFVREMTARGVGVACFTKGQVLGSDQKTKQFNQRYGITTTKQLCEELAQLKVSFLLSFQSFTHKTQNQLVGQPGHTVVRNRALANLVAAGFNYPLPTRLALEVGPITRTNYEEVPEIYVWGRERNMFVIPNFLMVSGKQIDRPFLAKHDLTEQEKIDLFVRIYSWNIRHGLQTLEQIEKEGISCMPGIHPCNQIACGLYITANGNVVGCPGFGGIEDIQGNVKQESLSEIWRKSQGRREWAGRFNCLCPPKDGITIPQGIYEKVLAELQNLFSSSED